MVAAGGVAVLAHGGPAEFAAPDDEGVFEQPALLQIGHEGGLPLVHLAAAGLEVGPSRFSPGPPWLSQLV